MKILVATLLLIDLFASPLHADSPRSIVVINEGWLFHKGEVDRGYSQSLDVSSWQPVDLPHTWNVDDSFDLRGEDDGLDITLAYYRGPGWYRKKLAIDPRSSDRRLFLKFEGANKVADVYVNEKHVGTHIGGYTGFEFDITDFIRSQSDNAVAVRVDNSYNYDIPPISADYTMYGGIYRDVYLVEKSPVYVAQALIATPEVSRERAEVRLDVVLANKTEASFSGRVEVIILDPEGNEALVRDHGVNVDANSRLEVSIKPDELESPQLWSPESPSLYSAVVRLKNGTGVVDETTSRFGLRWFRFDPEEGFFLNGAYLRLRGVNRHQDRAGYGNALPNRLHVEDMAHIKSVGANFVRLAHYPQDPAVLNACDSLGLLVWEEIPVVRSVGTERFAENSRNMLREMVIQHYNHPSIIIWGLMNEVMRDQRDEELHWAVNLCKDLNALAKELDPVRYTAQAQFKDRGTDVLTVTDIIGMNKYYGWYSDTFDYFGPYMDEQKELYPEKVFIISEYGAGSKRGYHVENPSAPDFSESWQLDLHQSYWKQISERKYIAGSAVWNMFDFGSDEKGGNIPHINQKGLMTFDRQPKDVYYFYQSQWTEQPMVSIVSHTWRKRAGREGEPTQVEVLSNCDEVELLVNGKSLGSRSDSFTWEATFDEGVNYLKALGRKGHVTVQDEMSLTYFIEE